MLMNLTLGCECRISQTQVVEEYCTFPKIDRIIQSDDFADVFKYMTIFDCDDLDWISRLDLCTYVMFPQLRHECEEYYLRNGKKLYELYNRKELKEFEFIFEMHINKILKIKNQLCKMSETHEQYVHNMKSICFK